MNLLMEHEVVETAQRAPQPEDAALLRAYCTQNDRAALGELFSRHAAGAFHFARRFLDDDAAAQDAVQDAFMVVLQNASTYRGDASVKSWLMGCVAKVCLNTRRAASRRELRHAAVPAPAPESAPEVRVEQLELRAAVLREVRALPPHYRAPLWLRHFEGLSAGEVAAVLGIPEKTVRNQIGIALEELRTALQRAGYTYSAVALPGILAALPLPAVPTGLLHSVRQLAVHGKLAVAASGAKTLTVLKLALPLMLVSGVLMAAWWTGRDREPRRDDPPPAQGEQAAPSAPEPAAQAQAAPNAALKAQLQKKIAADFRFDFINEVLARLTRETGARIVAAGNPKRCMFTLKAEETTAAAVVEKLAAQDHATLDYRGDTLVLWRNADSAQLAVLETRLKTGTVQERCEAAYDLARLGDPRVYATLFKALEDPEPAVVAWTVNGLNTHHADTLCFAANGGDAVPAIQKLLAAPPLGTSEYAVLTLLDELRTPAALNVLAARLSSADENTRINAAFAVRGSAADARIAKLLDAMLAEKSLDAPRAAAFAFARNRDWRGAEVIAQALLKGNSLVRKQAVACCTTAPDPRVTAALLKLLESHNEAIVMDALAGLTPVADQHVDAIEGVLNRAGSDALRSSCVWALAGVRTPAVLAPYEKLRASDSPLKQELAAYGLCVCRAPNALPLLHALPNYPGRLGLWVLGATREPAAIDELLGLIRKPNAQSLTAAMVVMPLEDGDATKLFETLLDDNDPARRLIGMRGLSCNPRAVATAKALCELDRFDQIAYAVFGAGDTRDPRLAEVLLAHCRPPWATILQGYAAHALAKLGDPRGFEQILTLLNEPELKAQNSDGGLLPQWMVSAALQHWSSCSAADKGRILQAVNALDGLTGAPDPAPTDF